MQPMFAQSLMPSGRSEPGVVAIAIERPSRRVLHLAEVWKSWNPECTHGNHELLIPLKDEDSRPLFLSPRSNAPHTLIAGSTGSGKSVLMQNIILGIACTNTPEQARIVLIDPKLGVDSDGFWTPLDADGKVSASRETAALAQLDPTFLECAEDAGFRELARRTLIARYFEPNERAELYRLCGLEVAPDDLVTADAARFLRSDQDESKRDAKFSVRVLPAYDFTCALTRYRMIAIDGSTPLDAAHIQQFKRGGPCEPSNGIALSKTAHWLFDRGFWSITDDYRVVVKSGAFEEAGEASQLLKPHAGRKIMLPILRSPGEMTGGRSGHVLVPIFLSTRPPRAPGFRDKNMGTRRWECRSGSPGGRGRNRKMEADARKPACSEGPRGVGWPHDGDFAPRRPDRNTPRTDRATGIDARTAHRGAGSG